MPHARAGVRISGWGTSEQPCLAMSDGQYRLFEGAADWSPDGSQIVYDGATTGDPSSQGVWFMDSDGSNRVRLVSGGFPAWRPLP